MLGERRTMVWWQWLVALAGLLAATLVVAPGPAGATVTSCTLSSTGIVFSPYDSQTKLAVDSAGTITVSCSGTQSSNAVSLHLTGGNNGACSNRVMRSGTNSMTYNVYRTAARTSTFCNGTSRIDLTFNLSSGSQTQTVDIYGRVSASLNPAYTTTAYTDTLTVSARAGTSSTGTFLGSTTVPISGSVAAICSVSAGTLGFGTYSGSIVNSTAAVTVNCTNTAPYFVSLGGGSNQSGSTRRMAGPAGNYLNYQLFADSLRTTPWGDDSAQLGARRSGTGSGSAQSLTVYGRIPAGQSPAAGSYSDSVVVTVEY